MGHEVSTAHHQKYLLLSGLHIYLWSPEEAAKHLIFSSNHSAVHIEVALDREMGDSFALLTSLMTLCFFLICGLPQGPNSILESWPHILPPSGRNVFQNHQGEASNKISHSLSNIDGLP